MKLAATVFLALALAVSARRLRWEQAAMGSGGYDNPNYDYAHIPVAAQEASPEDYSSPYANGKPYGYERPYPTYPTQASTSSGSHPYAACTYKPLYTCDVPKEVAGTCGNTSCALPNLCLNIKKTVKKLVEVPVAVCAEPKLVCQEIKKPCGDTSCAYDETCKKSQTCEKTVPYATVFPQGGQTAGKPYNMLGAAPAKASPAIATANAVATSSPGGGPAMANANAYATSSPSPAPPKYPAAYPSQMDGIEGESYGDGYKPVCKDTFTCEKIDPKVCKTETQFVCVEKDPASAKPGYYQGYLLGWQPGYVAGQKCGDTVCDPGSFCATSEVEVCLDAIIEKDAARCGHDPKGAPTFCPTGHMCTELCAPEKKYVTVEVEESVCVSPSDVTYADEVAAAITPCGPNKCLPGYECNDTPVSVCDAGPTAPTGVDAASGDDPLGYYFYYDPNGSEDSKSMPGYYFYPHDEEGNDSGCGYYMYPRPESASPQVTSPSLVAPTPYYPYPAPSTNTAGNFGAGYNPCQSYGSPPAYPAPSTNTAGNFGAGYNPYQSYGSPPAYPATPTRTAGNSGAGYNPYQSYGSPPAYPATPTRTAGNSGSGKAPYYSDVHPYYTGMEGASGYYDSQVPYNYYAPVTTSGAGSGSDPMSFYSGTYPTAFPRTGGNGGNDGKGKYYRPSSPARKQGSGVNAAPQVPAYIPEPTPAAPAGKQVSGVKVAPKVPAYVPEPTPAAPASGHSTAKATSTSRTEGGNVYVSGFSETSGDGIGTIDASASSGDDTSAAITGGSSFGKAKVNCETKSADGKVADCEGTANHL